MQVILKILSLFFLLTKQLIVLDNRISTTLYKPSFNLGKANNPLKAIVSGCQSGFLKKQLTFLF